MQHLDPGAFDETEFDQAAFEFNGRQRGARIAGGEVLDHARIATLGQSERQLWANIVLPGALPFIVTGLRLAVGRGLIGMVLADQYTAISGIGYLIVRTAATYQVDNMFVPIVTLGILGITLTALLRVLERRVAPWTLAGEEN